MQIAAVILAAGASTRFGAPKQLARIGPRTLLEVVADVAADAGLRPVLAVVPSGMAVPPNVVPVLNDAPEAGLSRSLRLGIGAVPPVAEAAVVLLVDQPTVDLDHLRRLTAGRGQTPIAATRSNGVIGPPVLVERSAFDLVDDLAGDRGLRDLLRTRPHLVTPVDHAELLDVDTPADLERITERCPGCGTRYLPHPVDETHAYIGASSACWATFGEVLAREFGDPAYGGVHRHTIDVYAAQHPGADGRTQRQSVALHLVALCHWLEDDMPIARLNARTQQLAAADRRWPWLDPPTAYATTVADVLRARSAAEHSALVRQWAEATWAAWASHHDVVRAWAREAPDGG